MFRRFVSSGAAAPAAVPAAPLSLSAAFDDPAAPYHVLTQRSIFSSTGNALSPAELRILNSETQPEGGLDEISPVNPDATPEEQAASIASQVKPGKKYVVRTTPEVAEALADQWLDKDKGKKVKTRPMYDQKTGETVGEKNPTTGWSVRYPHTDTGTPEEHWNLEAGGGTNVHVIVGEGGD